MSGAADYTINLDSTVCSMAVEVQHRVLRGIPHLRNTMLQGMTASLSRIPEDYPKVAAFTHSPSLGFVPRI